MASDDFTQQLKSACRLEGREHVQLVIAALVKIEFATAAEAPGLIEQCFRSLHNIKGSAHAAEFHVVESLCHPMEDIMAAAKSGKLKLSTQLVDLLLEGIELVDRLLKDEDETKHKEAADVCLNALYATLGKAPAAAGDMLEVQLQERTEGMSESETATIRAAVAGDDSEKQGSRLPEGMRAQQKETLKVSADKLDQLMKQAEEMLALKAMVGQNHAEVLEMRHKVEEHARNWSRASSDIIGVRRLLDSLLSAADSPQDQLPWRTMINIVNAFEEILKDVFADVRNISRNLGECSHTTSNYVDVLLDNSKSLIMISCSSLFAGFPLLVRQLGRQLDKEAELTIVGGDIEMDRRILGELKDPLIHLLRNSLDHGIEPRAERLAAGKPAKGSLSITAEQVERMVELRIADDGRGIDPAKVKATAEKMGLISREESAKLKPHEALHLIFRSALSTSPIITEISGRGLGLAIVEEKIQQLGGSIAVETEKGKGTTFILKLPLTIATFRGVLVEVSQSIFSLPTANIDRVVRVDEKDIKAVKGTYTFMLDNALVPLAAMEDVLKLPPSFRTRHEDQLITVAVVRVGSEHVGFIVDDILGEQEILVKNLGPIFSAATGVLGVTVLGSGQLVPILNISDMVKTYKKRRPGGTTRRPGQKTGADMQTDVSEQIRRPGEGISILVVDDMVTARMLMRNIFESAGFTVRTANNGLEALTTLKEDKFDVVITDVEMPFMDGFKLTESIRADQQLNAIPVVIVTSMASREDRERGVAAGANAYFTKSNFDQAKLLEVVKNLA